MIIAVIASFIALMMPGLIEWFSFATTEGKMLIITFPLLILIFLATGNRK